MADSFYLGHYDAVSGDRFSMVGEHRCASAWASMTASVVKCDDRHRPIAGQNVFVCVAHHDSNACGLIYSLGAAGNTKA